MIRITSSIQRLIKLPAPVWTLRPLQKLAKASAFLRHPLNARKRKAYRAQRLEALELGSYITLRPQPDPIFRALNPQIHSPTVGPTDGHAEQPKTSHPAISAIIPNYNHARFLEERVRSILDQKLGVSELIILDDASTDNSKDVIQKIASALPFPVTTVFNETNSGSIFSQWNKGLNLAQNELVWICESDDSCDSNFLQELASYFNDPSIMLAFGRVDYIDADGNPIREKNDHLDLSTFWREPRIASAYAWFNGPFGAKNVIANVGGCIFRRQRISSDLLSELCTYTICGDWFLYSNLARGGRIAYEPGARSYFRLHGKNSSVAALKGAAFYEEHIRISNALRKHYGIQATTLRLLLQNAWTQCTANLGEQAARMFARRNPLSEILRSKRSIQHILITMPEHLSLDAKTLIIRNANELSSGGTDVTLLVHGILADAPRGDFSPSIPILSHDVLNKLGSLQFLRTFGVSLVISNAPEADDDLLHGCRHLGVSYSQVSSNVPEIAFNAQFRGEGC